MVRVISLKFLAIGSIMLFLVSCQTTVVEYNSPKSFTNELDAVELWMNDDGVNSAVMLQVNGQESWQGKSMQGAAMSVLLPSGNNDLSIRMVHQEFMELPSDQVLNINIELDPQFKYVFVSKYDKNKKSFSYCFEKIGQEALCKYGPTNMKRIITGKLSCTKSGSAYKFTK
jgi:hypothetical protein